MLLFCARRAHSIIPHTVWGTRVRGIFSFSKENIPLTPPRERTRGLPPRPRTLAVFILKNCTRCAIGHGVHGFAMNLLRVVTGRSRALLRGARVTLPRRQTACGMRHCCARRIVGTGDRRKLLCTPTRWAERHPQGVCRIRKASEPPTAAQQRIVGASQIV